MSDAQLIARFKEGDESAFETLFEKYRVPLHSFIARMTCDKEVASDILQETFMRFISNLEDYREEGKFKAWIFTTANNLSINHMQRKGIWKSMESIDDAGPEGTGTLAGKIVSREAGPDMAACNHELAAKIRQALENLPSVQKQVLLLREYSGLSFKDICKSLF